MMRVVEAICRYGRSNSIWEIIEETMGFRVKEMVKLFGCIKGYGSFLYQKLMGTGEKIIKIIIMAKQN